jgi:hypothetical protein
MTPGEAIHKFCTACVGSIYDVENCGGDHCLNGGCYSSGECWFYRFRQGRGRPSVKLLRKYCLYCTDGDAEWVRNCPDGVEHRGQAPCALHPFRMGRNINFILTDEQKAGRALRFQGKQQTAGRKAPLKSNKNSNPSPNTDGRQ